MITPSDNGSLVNIECMRRDSSPCPHGNTVGVTAFHVHTAALHVAGMRNQRAGRKIERVVVRDDHFVVACANPLCDGGWCWDLTACGDPEHCSPVYPCGICNPEGLL